MKSNRGAEIKPIDGAYKNSIIHLGNFVGEYLGKRFIIYCGADTRWFNFIDKHDVGTIGEHSKSTKLLIGD